MRILYLDASHWIDFAPLGHTVFHVPLAEYETPLEAILETLPEPPDCIIQQERLGGARYFLTGLEHAPCPTMFLSFDTHLNLYWHKYYARLFDAVLTPHLSLFDALPDEDRHPQVFRFSHAGEPLPWRSHASRPFPLAFCGRLTPERPLRSRMTALVRGAFSLELRQDATREEMFRLYADARIVPNEAIGFECNLRVFESASAGAAVLTPDCGPDQEAVFADGTEMLVYADGLDLCEKIRWLASNPEKTETMGRAAWERVQREHLPRHRAATVQALLPGLRKARATGADAALFVWLTRLERAKSGDRQFPVTALLRQSELLPQTPEAVAGMLHLLGSPKRKDMALDFCRALLATKTAAGSLRCNAAASACALAHGDTDLAFAFHKRQYPARETIPADSFSLCLSWAEAERLAKHSVRPGFFFDPDAGHLPDCAFEFLCFAKARHPAQSSLASAAQARLLKDFPAYTLYRLSLLEALRRENPAAVDTAELGRLMLFCCRVDEGLALLATAEAGKDRNLMEESR